ncbi:hypothetical protein L6R49_25785 [Myxococcota bacterium]|nr:hypothetical protein [Myxococcota bacterium]
MFRHPPRPLLLLAALVACSDRAERPAESPPEDSAPLDDTSPCDGWTDTVYPDADGDGFGVEEGAVEGCIPAVAGFSEKSGDCDDQNSEINPWEGESCLTEWDDNCDGYINTYPPDWGDFPPDDCTDYFFDNDADGWGVYGEEKCSCTPEAPYTAPVAGDCDDADPTIFRDGGGCLTFDEEMWTARVNGYQEGQRLGAFPMSAEFLIAELTGDLVPDLLVAASLTTSDDGAQAGALYLVPGPLVGDIRLDDTNVHRLEGGVSAGVLFFGSTVLVEDLNGDGVNELLVSGQGEDGDVWILDGTRWQEEGFDATVSLLASTTMPYSTFGMNAVSSDLDGDGVVELILGDDGDDGTAKSAGAVYIVTNPPAGHHDINDVSTAKLKGEAKSDYAGRCVADAGDTDGDGLGDVLIGAIYAYSGGAAYLVRGPVEGELSLADADAIFVSETGGANGGCGLAGGGDANGDGLDDLLIGAYTAYGESGAAYLVLSGGHAEGRSFMNESAEAMFVGHDVVEYGAFWAGNSVAFVEGADGTDALAIGSGVAKFFELSAGAVTFVVNPEPGVHLIGSVGLTLNGTEAPGALGWSLAAAPDVDGDGWGELLVGAPGMSPDGLWAAGSLFLVPGGLLSGL